MDTAARWYASEAGVAVADAFVDAVERAFGHIARHPGTGSPRWAIALNIESLRS